MLTRLARPEDARGIARVAGAVRYRAGEADGDRGFIYNAFPAREYRTLIHTARCAAVAEDDGAVAGFALVLDWTHGRAARLLLDQIAVAPPYAGRGVAQALLDFVRAQLAPVELWAEIMHWPVENRRSQAFFRRNGFRLEGETPAGDAIWGLYRWQRVE